MTRADGRARGLRRTAIGLCALSAAFLFAEAGWIHAKALLAQALLHEAWAETRQHGTPRRPWPWADTHPVAALKVPRLGIDQIVLAGDSGRVLAFGPGWAPASAPPGRHGNTILSGHRDTHFSWLRSLRIGDQLALDNGTGERLYRVSGARIADSRKQQLALETPGDRLTLVTCWPFDAVRSGGPMRYVVEAERIGPDATPASAPLPAPQSRLLAHAGGN